MSFADKYIDMTLHSGRAVDFIGQAINTYISNEGKNHLHFPFYTLLLLNVFQTFFNFAVMFE